MDWFLSLRKKRSANKESEDASENSNENTSNVFYTIRHFKKKLQKSSKVKHVQRDTGDAELSSEGELPAFPPPSEEFRIPVEINEVPNPPNLVPFNEPSSDMDCLMEKTRKELKKYKWFWPNFSRELAQNRLSKQANGSFLVRDSQTVNQFTLSFRSSGCTLHVRIDYKNNYW